jgi:hypothetical protein
MADCKYNYSHIVINSNTPPLENNYSDMKMKENKLKRDCQERLKNYKYSDLQKSLIWHHINSTTKV